MKLKLIPNWKRVALRSHSMWAVYLGIAVLVLPEIFYGVQGYDLVSPYLTGYLGVGLLIYGGLGRIIDQGIGTSLVAALALLLALPGPGHALGSFGRVADPAPPAAAAVALPTRWADTKPVAVPMVIKWEDIRTEAYLDTIASPPVWTICAGETEGVRAGDVRTEAECRRSLDVNLERYWRGWRAAVTAEALATVVTVPVDAAFTSLTWNIGIGAARGSTAVRRLNALDVPGACEALTWWNRAGQKVVRGLVVRRADERDTCLQGVRAAGVA
jgi:GH24 family phage-related lysozyme (muramidase)